MSSLETPRSRAEPSVRVLLAGCSPEQADSVRELLERSTSTCFDLAHASRLADALELPDAKEADVLLLDLSREGGTEGPGGLARARMLAPRLPLVVLSDADDENLALQAVERGARGYLVKGELNTRLLVTTLRAAVESQRAILQLGAARERERHLATHDPLTGLANRTFFNDRLAQAVVAARRDPQVLAVLYLDLDGFKAINDGLGQAVGDGLLRGVARQVVSSVGEGDTVARLGGDEFAVLLTGLSDELGASRVAEKVLGSLGKPIRFNRRSSTATGSIGIAAFPRDGFEPEDLLRKAETAMNHAKVRGRNRYEFFTKDMSATVLRRTALEARLRTALSDQALLLYYQPQFDLRRGRIIGCEALLRWRNPELGLLSPAQFLPLAEETGLIVPIGEWVVRTAFRQSAEWQATGHPGLKMAVNVASQQFRESGFAEMVRDALEESGLHPNSVELEITESSLLDDVETTVNTLSELKELGVRLSVDDFGTGYSSLAYLKRLPLDVLKIDQSFVQALATDPADATITATIVNMARGLGLATVAEGVETLQQLLLLGSYGCSRMQGYLFGRPSPPETFLGWLSDPPFRWIGGADAAPPWSA